MTTIAGMYILGVHCDYCCGPKKGEEVSWITCCRSSVICKKCLFDRRLAHYQNCKFYRDYKGKALSKLEYKSEASKTIKEKSKKILFSTKTKDKPRERSHSGIF